MCGIAGVVKHPSVAVEQAQLQRMGRAIAHRGPDSSGTWLEANVGLVHQRLAVIDLTAEGHQPMTSEDGRYVLVFNGEIYNFEALRARLSAQPYHGHSDTEVLLRAIVEWGLTATIAQLVGMFAFALYDRQANTLNLVRDRLGIKPLYYGWHQGQFLFASELHAIEAALEQRPKVSADSVALMMRHNHVPAPYCIYENFRKLPPGSIFETATIKGHALGSGALSSYWSPQAALNGELSMSDEQWQAALHDALREAVKLRLVSDVPLGGFLSGGIDSTLVVALMQEQSEQRVSTYTIGFDDQAFDEAAFAKATAAHLGTNHHELYLQESDVLDAVAQLPQLCDEPFADQSILPTYLLCKMARTDVTVALSGDGGDELMWGYQRYPTRERLDRLRLLVPSPVRPLAARVLSSQALAKTLGKLPLPRAFGRASRLGDKLQMSAQLLSLEDEDQLYRYLMSHWKNPTQLVKGSHEPATLYSHPPDWLRRLPVWKRMCVLDLLAYLPNDCLTKVDRASMAVGLEARVPLLDHRVVELAYGLPEHLVRRSGRGKILLRTILDEYVPRTMMDRPKSGFGVPLATWLRGPLRDWAHELLSRQNLEAGNLFNVDLVSDLHAQHQAGTADWSAYLWDVLMYQNWERSRA